VFQMKVANIMPGDTVEVTVCYSELLVPEEGVYQFLFRRSWARGMAEEQMPRTAGTLLWRPRTRTRRRAGADFGITVNVNAGMPIAGLEVPSHKALIENRGSSAVVTSRMKRRRAATGILSSGTPCGAGPFRRVSSSTGAEENFFLLMAQPPKRRRSPTSRRASTCSSWTCPAPMNGFRSSLQGAHPRHP